MTSIRYYKPRLDLLRRCAFLFVFFIHRMDLAPIGTAKGICIKKGSFLIENFHAWCWASGRQDIA
jgi:hypothetical protein